MDAHPPHRTYRSISSIYWSVKFVSSQSKSKVITTVLLKVIHQALASLSRAFDLPPTPISPLGAANVQGVATVQETTIRAACITQNLRAKTSVLSRTVSR